jgi:hypothetical protein
MELQVGQSRVSPDRLGSHIPTASRVPGVSGYARLEKVEALPSPPAQK